MKAAGSILGIVIALAVGYFIFKSQMTQGPSAASSPRQQIDLVGVESDLLAIGQAQRLYLASQGTYGTIDQLEREGFLTFSGTNRRGYNFAAEMDDGNRFRIVAAPSDPAKAGWPTLSIDETMQISRQ